MEPPARQIVVPAGMVVPSLKVKGWRTARWMEAGGGVVHQLLVTWGLVGIGESG